MNITTPPAVEDSKQFGDALMTLTVDGEPLMTPAAVHETKQLGDALATPAVEADPMLPSSGHYFTNAPGAGLFSGQWVPSTPATEQAEPSAHERPAVERFETAYEDLSIVKDADKKT